MFKQIPISLRPNSYGANIAVVTHDSQIDWPTVLLELTAGVLGPQLANVVPYRIQGASTAARQLSCFCFLFPRSIFDFCWTQLQLPFDQPRTIAKDNTNSRVRPRLCRLSASAIHMFLSDFNLAQRCDHRMRDILGLKPQQKLLAHGTSECDVCSFSPIYFF